MEKVIADILDALRDTGQLDDKALDRIVRASSKRVHDGRRRIAKKHILPYYLAARDEGGDVWTSWNVDSQLDALFVKTLQMKPRRTASGVATITVITKPWPCANRCVYCPDDPAMPKSYLSDEPACQRAERNRFHPYLQVASRLRTLEQMGHSTDKVELIVLGGTWLDYPQDYRTWFIFELFRALNDTRQEREGALRRPEAIVTSGAQEIEPRELEEQHRRNESADHRVVGLVVETRPGTVTAQELVNLRELGCTKIQLGVQSIDDAILRANGRNETSSTIKRALGLARLFGFKTHAHFMVNLLGATPDSDKRDFRTFATEAAFQPDEVKLYPCALVAGTELVTRYENGEWRPYSEQELVDVLSQNLLDAPPFMRISRMIRDISANDILVGNKKTNLRQLVELHVEPQRELIREIRFREIGTDTVNMDEAHLEDFAYETDLTTEHFLQWVTPDNRILGFLRLSLPLQQALADNGEPLPIGPGEAMIREVHVYGFATAIDADGSSAQHRGLGKALVERAAAIAKENGYTRLNVISSVGTRQYYRRLGFADNGLYQQRML